MFRQTLSLLMVATGVAQTVPALNTTAYLGRWYQVYSDLIVEATFENASYCDTADYGLYPNGTISVLNRERQYGVDGLERRGRAGSAYGSFGGNGIWGTLLDLRPGTRRCDRWSLSLQCGVGPAQSNPVCSGAECVGILRAVELHGVGTPRGAGIYRASELSAADSSGGVYLLVASGYHKSVD
jgi:hypothetical protein